MLTVIPSNEHCVLGLKFCPFHARVYRTGTQNGSCWLGVAKSRWLESAKSGH